MRDNPKVCVEIEEIRDKDHWATVLVFGRYEEILDSDSDSDARERALSLFQTRSEWWGCQAPLTSRPPSATRSSSTGFKSNA